MAIKKAVFHLGMPKAGCTSIQYTLFSNSAFLEKNGFRYLNEWGRTHSKIFRLLFSQSRTCTHNAPGKLKILYNLLEGILASSKFETLVFSGQFTRFFSSNIVIDSYKNFLKYYFSDNNIDITIVIFVRNPLLYFISALQENISNHQFDTMNELFETAIKQYEGIFNLHKHFQDFVKIVKFEDACLDEDGLLGYFLKTINFPKKDLKSINIHRVNESRCVEAIELFDYIEKMASSTGINTKKSILLEKRNDLKILKTIRGVKFDLDYQTKIEFWERLQETVHSLETIGIDYTGYKIPTTSIQETYSEQTIEGFIAVFPKLNVMNQKLFLSFFEMKYHQTLQEKFKRLYFQNSVPWKIYNSKTSLSQVGIEVKDKLRKLKKVIWEIWRGF